MEGKPYGENLTLYILCPKYEMKKEAAMCRFFFYLFYLENDQTSNKKQNKNIFLNTYGNTY